MNLRQVQNRIQELQEFVTKATDNLCIQIDTIMGKEMGDLEKLQKQFKKKRKSNGLKGKPQGKRQKNGKTVEQGAKEAIRALNGKGTTGDIAKQMLKDGFKTNSTKFNGVVGQVLASKKQSFKRQDDGTWIVIAT